MSELRATGGRWVVRNRPANADRRHRQLSRAYFLESAAHTAGFPQPRIGYRHIIGGSYARVVAFFDDARRIETLGGLPDSSTGSGERSPRPGSSVRPVI